MLLNGKEKCDCKRIDCERHGKCDECVETHKTKRYEPYCFRKKKREEAKKDREKRRNLKTNEK